MSWKWRFFIHAQTAFAAAWFAASLIQSNGRYLAYACVSFALLAHACYCGERSARIEAPR